MSDLRNHILRCSVIRRLLLAAVVTLAILPAAPSVAQSPDDNREVDRRISHQQRARETARQLVDSILSLQLIQLEDNGLTDAPVYRDIQTMQSHLESLLDREMSEVVRLLEQAATEPPGQRMELVTQSRELVRQIVARLSAERQRLMRRLQAEELVQQVRRLAELQAAAQQETINVGNLPERTRADAVRLIGESQKDISTLKRQLLITLKDVETWGGELGERAKSAFEISREAGIAKHIDAAATELSQGRTATAADSQQAALDGLERLLNWLRAQSGLVPPEQNGIAETAKALADRQRVVQQQTEQLPASRPIPEELVQDQAILQQQINELASALDPQDQSHPFAELAAQQALEAAGALLEERPKDAVAAQAKVIGHLEELAQAESAKAPSELAAIPRGALDRQTAAEQLSTIETELAEIAAKQSRAIDADEQDARNSFAETSGELKSLAEDVPSEPLKQALEEAAESASQAQQAPPEQRSEAETEALKATQRAQATAAEEAAAARRDAGAFAVGEMARAAEVLERAAAMEREIAKALAPSSDSSDEAGALTEDQARTLASRQRHIARLAEDVQESVRPLSEQAADRVQPAAAATAELADELQSQDASAADADARRASEAKAKRAAEQLAAAAQSIRDALTAEADRLVENTRRRADTLDQADQRLSEQLPKTTQALVEPVETLQRALQTIEQARAEQDRASGRPDLAAAREQLRELSQLAQQQTAVSQSLAQPATRRAAVAAQEELSRKLNDLVEQAQRPQPSEPNDNAGDDNAGDDNVTAALQRSAAAAKRAADEMIDDDRSEAAHRAAAEAAAHLQSAVAAAQQQLEQRRAASRSGKKDPAAQQKVAELAESAAAAVRSHSPSAAETLDQARVEAESAATELSKQSPDEAAVAEQQRHIETQLEQSAAQVQQALDDARRAAAKALADRGRELDDTAATLTDSIASGITATQRAAEAGRSSEANRDPMPESLTNAARAMQSELQHASSQVAAAAQAARRDQALAEAIAAMARQQTESATELAESREAAASGSEPAGGATPAAGSAGRQAARQQAAQRFAEAGQATGEAVVELTDQEQIANAALLEALKAAEQLMPSADTSVLDPFNGEQTEIGAPDDGSSLGTGFVPASPELTASLMAGQPNLLAAQNQTGSTASESSNADASPLAGQNPDAPNADSSNVADADSIGGSTTGPASGRGDPAFLQSRSPTQQPWFARLPESLQNAVRASSRAAPPKAYEERLERYFRSLD